MKNKKNKYTEQQLKQQLSSAEMQRLQTEYQSELASNPEFSLDPDPTGELGLSITEKCFVQHYVNFKSIATAAELAGIEPDVAQEYFVSYKIQQEIRRINRALYHRQFMCKLLTLDDLGGYLSSLLMDENVPIADKLKTGEKLRVVELIMRLNEMKSAAMQNPAEFAARDIETQLKDLSVATIQNMLATNSSIKEKTEIVNRMDDGTLTPEEKAFLTTLPVQELLKMCEDLNKKKGGGNDDSQ